MLLGWASSGYYRNLHIGCTRPGLRSYFSRNCRQGDNRSRIAAMQQRPLPIWQAQLIKAAIELHGMRLSGMLSSDGTIAWSWPSKVYIASW